jgi:hypothetical protein
MKFLAIGKVRGQCCDYGWGIRGNESYQVFEAESMEEAKQKVIGWEEDEYGDIVSMFGGLIRSDYSPRGVSLKIFAISDEFEFDLSTLQTQHAIEIQTYYERQQREADKKEFQRLKDKLKK